MPSYSIAKGWNHRQHFASISRKAYRTIRFDRVDAFLDDDWNKGTLGECRILLYLLPEISPKHRRRCDNQLCSAQQKSIELNIVLTQRFVGRVLLDNRTLRLGTRDLHIRNTPNMDRRRAD